MERLTECEAIVLVTYDVGEADRFCILYTREHGRFAARARGARKLQSRFGAALLPLTHVELELRELSGGGMLVTGATVLRRFCHGTALRTFSHASEGIELLLALTTDHHPQPELFNRTIRFLDQCAHTSPLLAYQLGFLHLIGLLPAHDDAFFADLSDNERTFLRAAIDGGSPDVPEESRRLEERCRALIESNLTRPLKAGDVVAAML